MNAQSQMKVTSVNGTLQAIVVQTALERAGIPAAVTRSKNGSYMDVMVPLEWVYDAQNLLAPERRSGELFCVPSESEPGK